MQNTPILIVQNNPLVSQLNLNGILSTHWDEFLAMVGPDSSIPAKPKVAYSNAPNFAKIAKSFERYGTPVSKPTQKLNTGAE